MYVMDVHLTTASDACSMSFEQVSISCGLCTDDRPVNANK
jgi:hypothetical protein